MGLRETKRAKLHARIVAIGGELFRARGFDATSVDEITRQAEISRQTFFNYFTGKDAVLTELGLAWLKANAEVLRLEPGQASGSVLTGMRGAIAAQARAIETDGEFMRVVVLRSDLFGARGDGQEHVRQIYGAVAGVIALGQRSGEIASDLDPQRTAEALVGLMFMTVRTWAAGYWGASESLEERLLAALDILDRGLRGSRA